MGLVLNYTVALFKPQKSKCNEGPVKNELIQAEQGTRSHRKRFNVRPCRKK